MWIVRLALRRPYTFVVMSILILIMGGLAILRTPTDIFPTIDIPVISIIWNYNGLVPQEMSDRIVTPTERNLTTTVDNIEHIESQSLYGIAVVKVFLRPNSGNCRRDRRRLSFLPIAHRACPFCSWRFPGKTCRSSNSMTTA